MKKIGKILLSLILVGIFPVSALAKPSIRAKVNRTLIGLNGRIEYNLTITGDSGSTPDPKIPKFPGFDTASTSQSSKFSFVNGSFAASKNIRLILIPRSEGTFTFLPAEIVVNRRVFKSESFTITVKGGASSRSRTPKSTPRASPHTPTPRPKGPSVRGNLFIDMQINKNQAYVGEQLILTFSFYRRLRLFQQPEYEEPDTTGFWLEDLPSGKQEESRAINGRHYMVQEISSALFPTASGDYTIGAATLRVKTGFFTRPQILTTKPIKVKVLPLPQKGRPAGFTGAIGQFVLSAHLDKKTVAAGKPVNLIITVAGRGNIKAIQQPVIEIPEGIRKYESKTVENITPDHSQVTGEKRYEIILVPQKEGKYTIKPIGFTYFEPGSARYKVLLSSKMILAVTPGEEPDQQIVYTGTHQAEIALLNKDIRFLKPYTGKLENQGDLLFRHWWFWPVQSLPVLIVLFGFLYKQHKEKSMADVRSLRLRRAHKMARKKLRVAEEYQESGDAKKFYGEVSRALCEYLGDKLNTAGHGMTLDNIRKELTQREISPDNIEPAISLLEQCDMARFSSHISSAEEMKQFLSNTEEVIVKLDKLLI